MTREKNTAHTTWQMAEVESGAHIKSPWQIYRKSNEKAYLENTFRHERRQMVKRCADNTRKNVRNSRAEEEEEGET